MSNLNLTFLRLGPPEDKKTKNMHHFQELQLTMQIRPTNNYQELHQIGIGKILHVSLFVVGRVPLITPFLLNRRPLI